MIKVEWRIVKSEGAGAINSVLYWTCESRLSRNRGGFMPSYPAPRTHIALLLCCATLFLATASAAPAQESPPPYLAVVEGVANIDRQGDVQAAAQNMPLVPGDRVTTLAGRVEILFPDGSVLDLD